MTPENYICDFKEKDTIYDDKSILINYHRFNKLNKTLRMFEYKGLPDTTPQRAVEIMFQSQGYTIWDEYEDKHYIFYGGLGGERDQNYMPTLATYANPYLNISRSRRIGEECVVIPNDYLYMGLLPINLYYSEQEAETDLSLRTLKIAQRLMAIVTAPDERTKSSLDELFKDLSNGKIKSILDDSFDNMIKTMPYAQGAQSQTIIQLLEAKQYEKGSWWNEIGVQSNYNMKRETITANENILNIDNLLPLSDMMLECRKKGFEEVNKKFGLNISVDFSSSWKKLRNEIKLSEQDIKPLDKKEDDKVQSIEQGDKNEE